LNFNEEIINDRQKDVNEIESMVYNLRDMMVDASKEISKQGYMVGKEIKIDFRIIVLKKRNDCK